MLRYAVCAVRLKTGALAAPVIPGAAANATGATDSVAAATSARRSCVLNAAFFMFFGFIAALLIAGVTKCASGHAVADMHLGHKTAEVLCIVREVIELWGVKVVGFPWFKTCAIRLADTGVQNCIQRFAAAQSYRVSPVFRVQPGLIPQQLGVPSHDVHRNA